MIRQFQKVRLVMLDWLSWINTSREITVPPKCRYLPGREPTSGVSISLGRGVEPPLFRALVMMGMSRPRETYCQLVAKD
jgi:hypothetical protein